MLNSTLGKSGTEYNTVQNDTRNPVREDLDRLKDEYSKAVSDLKAELMNEQNLKILALEKEISNLKSILMETNCKEVKECLAEDLSNLQSNIDDINGKPRFAAEIRPPGLGFNLPRDDITSYSELVDANNNFDPSTGVFTITDDNDSGYYSFQFSGFKTNADRKEGLVEVFINNEYLQSIYEEETDYGLMMSSVFTLHLQKGDEVKLYNYYSDSIWVSNWYPFTFTGYQI